MAQADSEIAFHSSPVFLNSKKRLGNGGRFDQLNFFFKLSVFPAKIIDLNNYKNQTIVRSEKTVGPRVNVELSDIKTSKHSKPSKGSAFHMLLTHREFYPLDY